MAAKGGKLGTGYVPAHYQNPTNAEVLAALDEQAMLGGHVSNYLNWFDAPNQTLLTLAQQRGMATIFNTAVTTTTDMQRATPIVPAGYPVTFTDQSVRDLYKQKMLAHASIGPERLFIAQEINLLVANLTEYDAFKSLAAETYALLKQSYPNLLVGVSHQWDVMLTKGNQNDPNAFTPFQDFSFDVHGLTSYPKQLCNGEPNLMQSYYYSIVRNVLPLPAQVCIVELGWPAHLHMDEDAQSRFFARIPTFVSGMSVDRVSICHLHDIPGVYNSDLDYVGLRYTTGMAKKAYSTVKGLPLI